MPDAKGVYYVVSWLVVIIGWIVVNQQNNRREERKEIRSALTEINRLVDELVVMAVGYHRNSSHSPDESRRIKLHLQKIGFRVVHLHFHSREVNQCVYELRNAITLKNFDSWKHQAQDDASDILENIYFCADNLNNELEDCFGRLYRQGFRLAIVQETRRFLGMLEAIRS